MRAVLLGLLLAAGCRADNPRAAAEANATASAQPAQPKAAAPAPATPTPQPPHPCLVQDGQPVLAAPSRAIGTEPFWAARTQGRCVTYSTPEDQAGTRIWTRVVSGPNGPVWNGALRGKRFQLSVQPMAGCSDGMSDNRYPLEAKLLVDGEERRGCAEPLSTGR